jgi:hypothetical protein
MPSQDCPVGALSQDFFMCNYVRSVRLASGVGLSHVMSKQCLDTLYILCNIYIYVVIQHLFRNSSLVITRAHGRAQITSELPTHKMRYCSAGVLPAAVAAFFSV